MRLRIQITKEPGIRFISHLEYMRTLERALRRAKVPVCYSEGFNPHMKFSLASALGVGVASKAEYAEIELQKDSEVEVAQILEQIKQALPWGMHLVAADVVDSKEPKLMASVTAAEYSVQVPCEGIYTEAIEAFNTAPSVVLTKVKPKNNRQTKEINVKEFVPRVQASFNDGVLAMQFQCKITPTGSMKARELLELLKEQFGLPLELEHADIRRLNMYRTVEGKQAPLLQS